MTLLKKSWLLACAFITTALLCVLSCNPEIKDESTSEKRSTRSKPAFTEAEYSSYPSGYMWTGIIWHTIYLFGDNGKHIYFNIPGADDSYMAPGNFAVSSDGLIWVPLTQFNHANSKIVCINPKAPNDPATTISMEEIVAGTTTISRPANVLADKEWLYVMRNCTLQNSVLTRCLISNTLISESIVLPIGGDGWGRNMAMGKIGERKYIALALYKGVVVVDCDTFSLVGDVQSDKLSTQIAYSKSEEAFVMAGVGRTIFVDKPADAGKYEKYVSKSTRHGLYEYTVPELAFIHVKDGKVRLEFRELSFDREIASLGLSDSSAFDISSDGSKAVCMNRNGIVVIDLATSYIKDGLLFDSPRDTLGGVANIGNDIFALTGNDLFDLKARKYYSPSTGIIRGCDHIASFP